MKPGTMVRVKDRGVATVVYHQLDGYGVIWGRHIIDEEDLPEPEALLRGPSKYADYECVGKDYKIIK